MTFRAKTIRNGRVRTVTVVPARPAVVWTLNSITMPAITHATAPTPSSPPDGTSNSAKKSAMASTISRMAQMIIGSMAVF